jgi:septum formation protein
MNFQTISEDYHLILASESSRRKSLLRQVNLPFHAVPSHIEEKYVMGKPSTKASRLAEKKARAVHSGFKNSWILGADTAVVIRGKILGKPRDHHDAESMLSLLKGKEHEVITGFCLLNPAGNVAGAKAITTLVRMRWLTENEINAYVATGEPFGKAGSYAIQGIGAFMVESISGSYTNVVGLPVCAVIESLLAAGALKDFPLPA